MDSQHLEEKDLGPEDSSVITLEQTFPAIRNLDCLAFVYDPFSLSTSKADMFVIDTTYLTRLFVCQNFVMSSTPSVPKKPQPRRVSLSRLVVHCNQTVHPFDIHFVNSMYNI